MTEPVAAKDDARTLTYTAAFRFEEGWWWAQAVEVPVTRIQLRSALRHGSGRVPREEVIDLSDEGGDFETSDVERFLDLGQGLEVRAAEVSLRLGPIAQPIPERHERAGRRRPVLVEPGRDDVDPTGLRASQPGDDQFVLGPEVPVERGLRDVRVLDQGVHARRSDALAEEEIRRGPDDPVAWPIHLALFLPDR